MGRPMPRIRLRKAVSNSISSRLPIDSSSTRSASTRPTPVCDTAPTMMPAAAVAMPMPIMLRAPAIRPSRRSITPSMKVPSTWLRSWRIHDSSGRWVSRMITSITEPQKAERPGDSRSTIRHQTSTTTGSRKCRPESSTDGFPAASPAACWDLRGAAAGCSRRSSADRGRPAPAARR